MEGSTKKKPIENTADLNKIFSLTTYREIKNKDGDRFSHDYDDDFRAVYGKLSVPTASTLRHGVVFTIKHRLRRRKFCILQTVIIRTPSQSRRGLLPSTCNTTHEHDDRMP